MKYLLILAFIPCVAYAHEDDHAIPASAQNIYQVTNIYNSTYLAEGVASAIAVSQLHFDGSTHQLQIAVGAGNYDDRSAVSVGMAQKLGAQGPLISFSASRDSSHTGVGVGITFRL